MSWSELVARLQNIPSSQRLECLKWANDSLRESLISGDAVGSLSCQTLARLTLFKAMSLTDDSRLGKKAATGINAPRWTGLAQSINEFSSGLPSPLSVLTNRTYTDDALAQFATMSSRKRGSAKAHFYSTILLYLVHEAEVGTFDSEYFRALASRADRVYPRRLPKLIADRVGGESSSAGSGPKEVSINYLVRSSSVEKIDRFVANFSYPLDIQSSGKSISLIVYRPMISDPSQLVKSFLSIFIDTKDKSEQNAYRFTQITPAPQAHQQNRIAMGKLIPVDDAAYLVGGERALDDRSRTIPYNSLFTAAIRWFDLERMHSVFPMTVMSTGYTGRVILSRSAARVTPVTHSSDASLGSVSLSTLHDSISEDRERELKFLEAHSLNTADLNTKPFPLTMEHFDPDGIVQQISEAANNEPRTESGWSVAPGFVQSSGRKSRTLTNEALRFHIAEALGEAGGSPFENVSGEVFSLWKHIRFGPLSAD